MENNTRFEWTSNGEGVTITRYIGDDPDVVIPESIDGKPVTAILWWAFDGHTEIISITVPETVLIHYAMLDDNPFSGSTLTVSIAEKWGDEEISAGSVVTLKMKCPLLLQNGNVFNVTLGAYSPDLSEQRYVTAKLISVLTREQGYVVVQAEVQTVGDERSFVKRLKPSERKELENRGTYEYVRPKGERAGPFVSKYDKPWLCLYNSFQGDYNEYHTIYTDEDGVDHLIKTEYNGIDTGVLLFGDRILGMHKNCPFQRENDLLIDRENKTLLQCETGAVDVLIPDEIETIADAVFDDLPMLKSITVPAGVKHFLGAFGNCPSLETIYLAGSQRRNPEFWEEIQSCFPQAEIIFERETLVVNIFDHSQENRTNASAELRFDS